MRRQHVSCCQMPFLLQLPQSPLNPLMLLLSGELVLWKIEKDFLNQVLDLGIRGNLGELAF